MTATRRYGGDPLPWLLAIIALPSALFYFGLASSLALGTTVVALGLVFWASINSHRQAVRLMMRNVATLAMLLLVFLTAHLLAVSMHLRVDLMRALTSLMPATAVLVGSTVMAHRLINANPASLDRSIRCCALLLLLAGTIGGLGLAPPTGQSFVKPMFPYSEPSHFALVFAPLLIYTATTTKGWRRMMWLGASIALALWVENLTLVVGVMLATCLTLNVFMLIAFLALLGAVATQLDLAYFTSRLLLSEDSDNLSVLVFIQGWELLADALNRSAGWGIGFQQLGLDWRDSPAADAIYAMVQENLNVLDGGLTFVKLGGELGVFGLLIGGLLLALAATSTVQLRILALGRKAHSNPTTATIFARCAVVGFSLELLVRGLGYFTPTSLLMLAALWVLFGQRLGGRSFQTMTPAQRATTPT